MLIVTDKPAIDAAFTAKTPRPIREVMLEIYPDATEDRNGRFHAPYDGYECAMTGKVFRAGEFLPMEEDEENYRIMGTVRKIPTGRDAVTGEIYTWNGSFAQNREVWGLLIAQSKAFDAANSAHLGSVGAKLTVNVVVSYIHTYSGFYGQQFIHIMKAGNDVIIYKGAKKLAGIGDEITVTASVKEHGMREGVKQTVIQRPKVSPITVQGQVEVEKNMTLRERMVESLDKLIAMGRMCEDEAAVIMKDWDALPKPTV
jgi:hypothetical protein